jgi:plasmid stability protein
MGLAVLAFCCQIAGMANLTIRNFPDGLHQRLKAQAKRNRRSLNQEVIAELAASPLGGQESLERERVNNLIALAARLRRELTTPLTAAEIRAGIDEGRM